MFMGSGVDATLCWKLLYTKSRSERWAEMNLRNQGFATLLPLMAGRSGFDPLFPRYLFAGHAPELSTRSLGSTFGVLYVVTAGWRAAHVPPEVITELCSRMDSRGIVQLDEEPRKDSLFARQQRERLRTLVRFAEAGFRVRSA
jgi:hypothetical protein